MQNISKYTIEWSSKFLFVIMLMVISQVESSAQADLQVDGNISVYTHQSNQQTDVVVQLNDGRLAIRDMSDEFGADAEQQLPLTTNWSNYGSGYKGASYYKHLGHVYLDGLVRKSGTIQPGEIIATLPIGCRPTKINVVAGVQNGNLVYLEIKTTGQISIRHGLDASKDYIGLRSISFKL